MTPHPSLDIPTQSSKCRMMGRTERGGSEMRCLRYVVDCTPNTCISCWSRAVPVRRYPRSSSMRRWRPWSRRGAYPGPRTKSGPIVQPMGRMARGTEALIAVGVTARMRMWGSGLFREQGSSTLMRVSHTAMSSLFARIPEGAFSKVVLRHAVGLGKAIDAWCGRRVV
jgi:hypothetical protein